jgi:hypothetical protein
VACELSLYDPISSWRSALAGNSSYHEGRTNLRRYALTDFGEVALKLPRLARVPPTEGFWLFEGVGSCLF